MQIHPISIKYPINMFGGTLQIIQEQAFSTEKKTLSNHSSTMFSLLYINCINYISIFLCKIDI